MFSAIIVDDEKPALDVLRLLLEKTGQICVIGSFMSAADALKNMQNLKPDIAFLDIEMSDMSGLALAEKIIDAGLDMEIVFVTAYDKYALEAFRVNAIDYILKPFSADDIAQVITRLNKMKRLPAAFQVPADQGRIYCFGKLLVYGAGSGEAVKWRTAKSEELFALLLQNLNTNLAKWKIMQVLWPECETEGQINTNLYTTVYKVKKTLLSANIKFELGFTNGSYKMELPDVYTDAFAFEKITDAKTALTAASIDKYKKAISLYKGNYLEDNEYPWSQNKAEEYANRYSSLVFDLAGYYTAESDYLTAEKILQKALTIIPLVDELNEMLLRLYFMQKNKTRFIAHYNKIKRLYKSELGITPNMSMQELFNSVLEM